MDKQKRELLREGLPVELEPGVYGRLNSEKRSLDLSNGRSLPVPEEDQRLLFPENEAQKRGARSQEALQSRIENTPFGEALFKVGEHSNVLQFFKGVGENFLQRPVEATQVKPGQESLSFFERLGENKANEIQAYQSQSERISKENPYSTAAGALGGIGVDLFATRNLNPAAGAATLSLAGNAENIAENPKEVLEDVALSAAAGYGLDKTLKGLSSLANKRGAYRSAKQDIARVEAENIAGKEAQDLLNAQRKAANETERQSIIARNANEESAVSNLNSYNKAAIEQANFEAKQAYASQVAANEQAIQQYKLSKAQRDKEIFDLQQNYQQQRAARDAKVFQAEQEYKIAKQNHSATEAEKKRLYEKAVQDRKTESARLDKEFQEQMNAYKKQRDLLPQLQKEAQREFSANTIENIQKVAKVAGEDAKFSANQLGIGNFIEDVINSGELAATPAGREASNFLKKIFSKAEGRAMTANELVQAYESIEGRIARGTPELKQVLSEFKDYMSQRIPQAVSDSKFFTRQMPRFEKALLSQMDKASSLLKVSPAVNNAAKQEIKSILGALLPEEFAQLAKSGQLKKYITENLRSQKDLANNLKGSFFLENQEKIANYIEERASKIFSDLETEAFVNFIDTQKALGGKINKTKGFAADIAAPEAPLPPSALPEIALPQSSPAPVMGNVPEPIAPPSLPSQIEPPTINQPASPVPRQFSPLNPNIEPVPPKFTPEPFMPQQVPSIPESQGIGDSFARGLEDLQLSNMLKSKSLTDNPLTKLATLKYVLGKAALPVEAAAAGGITALKTLTSPGAAGDISRAAFKQGMIGLIDGLARRYPSYRNGILDNPLDRRSLVKEIEENQNMSLEDKAIYQSKVNRGEPLQQPIAK